jgi:hypothetical protein
MSRGKASGSNWGILPAGITGVPGPAGNVFNAPVTPKLGRNDPCWCGSGKKYKKCHLEKGLRRGR